MLTERFIAATIKHGRLHKIQNQDIRTDLQLEADEHDQEDKADTQHAHGQADQPPEQAPPPRRIVELFTACYGAAALHSLSRRTSVRQGQETSKDREANFSSSHPELRSRFLQGLSGRVQCSPFVCQLSLPPLPALQEQGGPHHVEECKHHAADVPACLKPAHQRGCSFRYFGYLKSHKLLFSPDQIRSASTAQSRSQPDTALKWCKIPTRQSTWPPSPRSNRIYHLKSNETRSFFC